MDQVRQVTDDARGVLQPALAVTHVDLRRFPPAAAVAPFVRHYWSVSWDHPREPYRQAVLPHPAVNVVFGPDYANVYGLIRDVDVQVLEGRSWVLGVLFRPAGFSPFWPASMEELAGRVRPVPAVFGPAGEAAWAAVLRAATPEARAAAADAAFAALAPTPPARMVLARDLVEEIAADRSLQRVDQLADRHRLSVRAVQRLFREQVGASPKWTIRRYRLLEAAERAGREEDVSWAALAAALGYSDQPHLTREFAEMVGFSPAEYARACREGRPLPR